MTYWAARRTEIRPGREQEYRRVHARVPDAVLEALRRAGVVRWHIWIEGSTLFHAIATRQGYAAMLSAITAHGVVDPAWDRLVASLLESAPTAQETLTPVWSMDAAGQHPGEGAGDGAGESQG